MKILVKFHCLIWRRLSSDDTLVLNSRYAHRSLLSFIVLAFVTCIVSNLILMTSIEQGIICNVLIRRMALRISNVDAKKLLLKKILDEPINLTDCIKFSKPKMSGDVVSVFKNGQKPLTSRTRQIH